MQALPGLTLGNKNLGEERKEYRKFHGSVVLASQIFCIELNLKMFPNCQTTSHVGVPFICFFVVYHKNIFIRMQSCFVEGPKA